MKIVWSSHVAGFVRKHAISIGRSPFFNNVVTVFSGAPLTESLPVGALSAISSTPSGLGSLISAALDGVSSSIIENTGTLSPISDGLNGVTSTINNDPTGTQSTMQ